MTSNAHFKHIFVDTIRIERIVELFFCPSFAFEPARMKRDSCFFQQWPLLSGGDLFPLISIKLLVAPPLNQVILVFLSYVLFVSSQVITPLKPRQVAAAHNKIQLNHFRVLFHCIFSI